MADTKSIKFYTTTVPVSKTVNEVTALLVRRGAQRITSEYDSDGNPTALLFIMDTDFGPREYSVPVRSDGVLRIVEKDTSIPKNQRTRQKAERIAWRLILSWLDTQFALIDAEMTSVAEVMLPYMVSNEGSTMYEIMHAKHLGIEQ